MIKQALLLSPYQITDHFLSSQIPRSMFPHPGNHTHERWAQECANEIRAAARALTRLIGTGTRHNEWRDRSRQPWQGRWVPRGRRQRFYGPPRGFQRRPEPQRWQASLGHDPRSEMSRQQPRGDWRTRALPRRGHPVAIIRVPRWNDRGERCTREPRGLIPRGALRGGPERTADDPRRKPRGSLCGGPARSAKEPQLQDKTVTQRNTNGETPKPKNGKVKRPTIITVDDKGCERRWGHSLEQRHGELVDFGRTWTGR